MSLLSDDKYKQGSGKIPTSTALEQEENGVGGDDRPCKTRRISTSISNLPDDCLSIIARRLNTTGDGTSFGLTCHQWLRVQNNNLEDLYYRYGNSPDESFLAVLCKLLSRFQRLKTLSLENIPEITDIVTSNPPFFESKVLRLNLKYCYENSDITLGLIFSWLPRLTYLLLLSLHITDKGLEVLAKCCSSLKEVILIGCGLITDSGISLLLQNCRELGSLSLSSCSNITGTGFLGCSQTLTHLTLGWCKLNLEGINAIVSGGGIESLSLSSTYELPKAGERSINSEAVMYISKGCPLLKKLSLRNYKEVELEGWEAIGQNCKNLEDLTLYGRSKLCDLGLQALCNGCNKLSRLSVDAGISFSSSALELFKRKNIKVTRRNTY